MRADQALKHADRFFRWSGAEPARHRVVLMSSEVFSALRQASESYPEFPGDQQDKVMELLSHQPTIVVLEYLPGPGVTCLVWPVLIDPEKKGWTDKVRACVVTYHPDSGFDIPSQIPTQFVGAFDAWCSQTVIVASPQRVSRKAARRWHRETDGPMPEISVVTLRKRRGTPSATGSGNVEWKHQWVVDGHWRNQWHPSTGTHVPTWIDPYVKGPEGAPMLRRVYYAKR